MTGDQPSNNGPKAVNEFNGASLIKLVNILNSGKIMDGTEIASPKRIYAGAADDLYTHQSKPDAVDSLISKINSGAKFVQTQYCFDIEVIKFYSDLLLDNGKDDSWKVLVGMGPLKSAKQADWMRKNLWGINISDEIVDRLNQSKDSISEGEEICVELIDQIKDLPGIDGVHLMGPNCESQSANIIKSF